MGSNYQEDHQSIVLNSQEEVHETQYSSSDQENDDLGVGRSYECVFCKRGFNTAQALGGHMNIHRKDRARSRGSKPTTTTTTTTTASNEYSDKHHLYTGPRLYQQIISPSSAANHHHHFAASHIHQDHHHHLQPRLDMSSYYETAASTSSNTNRQFYIGNDEYYDGDYRQLSDPISVPADHNWRLSLSLDFSPMMVEDLEMNRPQAMNIQKEELDLELRLGYDH